MNTSAPDNATDTFTPGEWAALRDDIEFVRQLKNLIVATTAGNVSFQRGPGAGNLLLDLRGITPSGAVANPFPVTAARVYRTANLSVANNTPTYVAWQIASYDTDGIFSLASPTRLTVRTAGIYEIRCSVAWASNGTGSRFIYIDRNGVPEIAGNSRPAVSGGSTNSETVTHYECAAGDYLQVRVEQSSGGSLNIIGTTSPGDDRTNFSIARIR